MAVTEEVRRDPEVFAVWIGEEDRIASFHAVETYELKTFSNHSLLLDYLRALQENGYRFQ